MTHSTFAQPMPSDLTGNLAAPHIRDSDSFLAADDVYLNMRPAGSLSTTATDMATFMRTHLGDGVVDETRMLDAETSEALHSRHHVRHPAVTNWRYGFHEYGDRRRQPHRPLGRNGQLRELPAARPGRRRRDFVAYNSNPSELPKTVVDEIVAEYELQPAPTTPTSTSRSGGQERAETVAGEYSLTDLPQSGHLQVVDLLEYLTVEPAANGRLWTTTLEGDVRQWVETEPYVYGEVGGHGVLAFEVTDGQVDVLNMNNEPTGVYQPVPFHERQPITGGVLGTALSGFGLSLAGWGGHSAWQQWKQNRADENPDMEDSE
jgi:hypothetical protein